jgi:hypothetical protein
MEIHISRNDSKKHLTPLGFKHLLSYYAAINRGMSTTIKSSFPDIIPVSRNDQGNYVLTENLNPNWISGFFAGEGSFTVGIRKDNKNLYYNLNLAQHIRDLNLIFLIQKFFGCGSVYFRPNLNRCDFVVQSLSDIVNNLIPHF